MNSVQNRRERKSKENLRQEILDAARELFAREGVESVSIRKIADRIDCAPGTLYLHFNDKAEILTTLCDETFAKLNQRIQAIKDDRGDLLAALRRGLRAYIEFGLQNPNHYLVTFVLAGRAQPQPAESDMCCFDNLRGIVRKCIDAGLFRLDDVEEAAQVLWSGIHGLTTLLITRPGFPFIEQTRLVDRLVDVLVEGVRRR